MKSKKNYTLAVLISLILPFSLQAAVKINEVAWMGNEKGQYGEWIELYNNGETAVDLKDAVLYEGGGKTLIIKLTKVIDPHSYYITARSTPSVPDPVLGTADDLGSFGGNGLSNSGEFLLLKSAGGEVLDSLDASSGWPAGDSQTKQTMQLAESGWVTATATPRSINHVMPLQSGSTSTGQDLVGMVDTTAGTNHTFDARIKSLSVHSSPSPISNTEEEPKLVATSGRDRLVLVDSPIAFEVKMMTSKGETVSGGDIFWTFGDGTSATGKNIVHTYKFPGDYIVITNITRGGEELVSRANVRVVAGNLVITDADKNYVKIINGAGYEANIGGWRISSGQVIFTFPKDTIIFPGKEIVIPRDVLGFYLNQEIKLLSPVGNTVSVFAIKSEDKSAVVTTMPIKTVEIVATTSMEAMLPQGSTVATTTLLLARQQLLGAREKLNKLLSAPVVAPVAQVNTFTVSDKLTQKEVNTDDSVVQVIEKPKAVLKTILDLPSVAYRFVRGFLW